MCGTACRVRAQRHSDIGRRWRSREGAREGNRSQRIWAFGHPRTPDGFRAAAYVEDSHCELEGHVYRRFPDLCEAIAADVEASQRSCRAPALSWRAVCTTRTRSDRAEGQSSAARCVPPASWRGARKEIRPFGDPLPRRQRRQAPLLARPQRTPEGHRSTSGKRTAVPCSARPHGPTLAASRSECQCTTRLPARAVTQATCSNGLARSAVKTPKGGRSLTVSPTFRTVLTNVLITPAAASSFSYRWRTQIRIASSIGAGAAIV